MTKLKANNVKFRKSVGTTSLPIPIPAYNTATLSRTLTNPNYYGTTTNDYFGQGGALSGNYAIISANGEDISGNTNDLNAGVVYWIDANTGSLIDTVIDTNAYWTRQEDRFGGHGQSITTSNNYVAIGVPLEEISGTTDYTYNSGVVYIYDANTRNLQITITNPNAFSTAQNDRFGSACVINGNQLYVSAPEEDYSGGSGAGKVYLYETVTGDWTDATLVHTFSNPNAFSTQQSDNFGYSLAVSDSYIIISAVQEKTPDSGVWYSGAVYIYDRVTRALLHSILNPDFTGNIHTYFGYSVAINDTYAIVSNPRFDDASEDTGRVYIYDIVSGTVVQTLENPNSYSTPIGDQYGYTVHITPSNIFVSSPLEDRSNEPQAGVVYMYDIQTLSLLQTITNPNGQAGTLFGMIIDTEGNKLMINSSDVAYIYELSESV